MPEEVREETAKEETVRLTVRCTTSLVGKIDRIVEEKGYLNRNVYIQDLLEKAINGNLTVTNVDLENKIDELEQRLFDTSSTLSFMMTVLGQLSASGDTSSTSLKRFSEANTDTLRENSGKPITTDQFIRSLRNASETSQGQQPAAPAQTAQTAQLASEEFLGSFSIDPGQYLRDARDDSEESEESPARPASTKKYASEAAIRIVKEKWKTDPSALGEGQNFDGSPATFSKEEYDRGDVEEMSYF